MTTATATTTALPTPGSAHRLPRSRPAVTGTHQQTRVRAETSPSTHVTGIVRTRVAHQDDGPHEPAQARSPVGRAVTGTVAAARFAGHFVAACVSVAVLGVDADL